MKRGLFINNKKAKDSIYESGFMVYQCLKNSTHYSLDYCEISFEEREIKTGFDFYFFNYHPVTMGWLETKSLKKDLGYVMTMILEVAPNDAFVMCPKNHFSLYLALDPTLPSKPHLLYSLPRPLENVNFILPANANNIPVIGSFGFATRGKGFHHVVEAVNKEFDKAIVRINIPYGDFVPDSKEYAFFLGEMCRQKAKPGIEVEITHDFMLKNDLIKWCASNTLNCFLYDRDMPGLSATTDQAIVSEIPLAVSSNDTFRHILLYIKPYPQQTLKQSIQSSGTHVKKMKEDWMPAKFLEQFEHVILENANLFNPVSAKTNANFILRVKANNLIDIFYRRLRKYTRMSTLKNIKVLIKTSNKNEII